MTEQGKQMIKATMQGFISYSQNKKNYFLIIFASDDTIDSIDKKIRRPFPWSKSWEKPSLCPYNCQAKESFFRGQMEEERDDEEEREDREREKKGEKGEEDKGEEKTQMEIRMRRS